MKLFFIFLSLCAFLWANTSDQIFWYNSIELSHSTTFRKNIFTNDNVTTDPSLSNIFDDHHLTISSFNYITKVSYRYLFASLLLNYTYGEDQFFDINNVLTEFTVRHEQFTLMPEVFFKWKLLAVGVGYFITFEGDAPHRYAFLFNKDSPFLKINLDQQLGKIPLYALTSFYLSPNGFNFDDSTIYSLSVGFRWYMTYYASLSMRYTRTLLESEGIEDNIVRILFNYRITPSFSVGVYYSQLVYTSGRNPYNEISVNVTYLHAFGATTPLSLDKIP